MERQLGNLGEPAGAAPQRQKGEHDEAIEPLGELVGPLGGPEGVEVERAPALSDDVRLRVPPIRDGDIVGQVNGPFPFVACGGMQR